MKTRMLTALLLASTPILARAVEGEATLPTIPLPQAEQPAPSLREEHAVQLAPVVVTGEKLGRSLEQTAASVHVTSGQQMDDYGDESVFDLMERVANVAVSPEGGFSIRGVGSNGADGFGAGQAVISTYIDGVAVDSTGQAGGVLDTFDIDQVEILRGAQSTSQGRSALAGAVIINSREPTDEWDLRARLRGGELGERRYALAGGGPLGGGFSFRLVGDRQETDGYIRNLTLNDPDWNAVERETGRARLAWRSQATPGLGVLLSASSITEHSKGRSLTVENDSEQPGAHRTAIDDYPGRGYNRSTPYSLRIDTPLGEKLTMTSTTGYIDSHTRIHRDLDQTRQDYGVANFDNRGRNLTQELRLNLRDNGRFSGVAGLYAGRFESDLRYQPRDALIFAHEALPIPPQIGELIALRVDNNQLTGNEARNIAGFAEFDWAATPRLTLTAGLRYDREKRDTTVLYSVTRADGSLTTGGRVDLLDSLLGLIPPLPLQPLLGPLGLAPGDAAPVRSQASYDALLPKLGLRYALTEKTSLLLGYSEAYRPGGAETIPSTGEQNVFEPEYTRTWETGLRTSSFGNRLRTRLNLYYTRWDDQQVSQPASDGLTFYTQNAASSTLYGTELENELGLTPRWNAYLSVGYAHTEFDDYSSGGNDYSGNEFVSAPRFTGSIGSVWRSAAGWFASSSFQYASASYGAASNEPGSRSDIRRTVDARLGYEGSNFALVAYARNLLDEDYAYYRYRFNPGLGVPEPATLIGYGEPRVLGLQLEVFFP
jgi:iron complex outermembrane receptor protein